MVVEKHGEPTKESAAVGAMNHLIRAMSRGRVVTKHPSSGIEQCGCCPEDFEVSPWNPAFCKQGIEIRTAFAALRLLLSPREESEKETKKSSRKRPHCSTQDDTLSANEVLEAIEASISSTPSIVWTSSSSARPRQNARLRWRSVTDGGGIT